MSSPRLTSILAITIYLAASFLPCEPPADLRPGFVASASRSLARAVAPTHSAPSSRSHDAHGASHATGHAEHAPPASHRSDEAVHPDHSGHTDESAPRLAGGTASSTELKPQCPCGCGDTRSTVGGGAARLGAVVPGSSVARLVEAPRAHVVDLWRGAFSEAMAPRDPVPI